MVHFEMCLSSVGFLSFLTLACMPISPRSDGAGHPTIQLSLAKEPDPLLDGPSVSCGWDDKKDQERK